jgi:hypothetical protein
MHRAGRDIGFPASASCSPVSGGTGGSSLCAVHRALANTVSSSRRLLAFYRVPSVPDLPARAACADHRAPPLGLRLPLRDISHPRRSTGVPSPAPSVLGVSHALDGLIRGRPCGFISPHSHVQGSPSRGFPPRTAAPIRHRHVPSRRLATVDYCGCPQRHLLPPRPQGFTLSEGPLPAHQFYPLRRPDPLLGFSSSRCSLSKPRKNE